MPPAARPIVFLSDFGLSNEWVGISHAVLNRIAPRSSIVDLSHLVPPLDVLPVPSPPDATIGVVAVVPPMVLVR